MTAQPSEGSDPRRCKWPRPAQTHQRGHLFSDRPSAAIETNHGEAVQAADDGVDDVARATAAVILSGFMMSSCSRGVM